MRWLARAVRPPCSIAIALLLSALAGCGSGGGSGPFSDNGQALMIVVARQPIYSQSTCSQPSGDQAEPGATVIALGTMGTNCERIVYLRDGEYGQLGYLPVYGMRRAAGGVRCRSAPACNLRAGPDTAYPMIGSLAPGDSARGYGTGRTSAIITDGANYNWWEVIDPATGARADVYGPNCQVF